MANTAPARNIPMAAMNVHRNRSWPCPNGRSSLGPLLRYVGETEAVIWVEPDRSCEVEVLGRRERTFCVCGHHYALVRCGGLDPGRWYEYQVRLDGELVWPRGDDFPPSS